MAKPLKRVRRKRRSRVSWKQRLRIGSSFLVSFFVVLGFGVGLFSFSSARKGWERWHKARLLAQAADQVEHGQLEEADALARKALNLDPDSIEASRILAEATEKENDSETVAWRAQIARLDPGLDSQLNLASAALRFGQLDIARDALERVDPADRNKAAYQVVAGSRAPREIWRKKNVISPPPSQPNRPMTFTNSISPSCKSTHLIRRKTPSRATSSNV